MGSPGTRTPGRRPTSPATPARAASGPRPRTTSGRQDPAGTAVSYVTEPLERGHGRRSAPAAWTSGSAPRRRTSTCRRRSARSGPTARRRSCRAAGCAAKARKLDDAKSTPLEPVLSLREEDFAAMPHDQFVKVTIPLYYEGHMYRSRLADPGEDLGAQRRPADLGVQRGGAGRAGERRDRLRRQHAVAAASCRSSRA